MKNYALGLVMAAFVTATPVMAQEFAVVGQAEYSVESELFEVEAGPEFTLNQLVISPVAKGEYFAGEDLVFAGVDVNVDFNFNENVSAFATVEFDKDIEYNDLTVGVAFRF